jgi:hypothetical protein
MSDTRPEDAPPITFCSKLGVRASAALRARHFGIAGIRIND